MRRFFPRLRFSLRALLLTVPAVVAIGCCWNTWPRRTLDRFLASLYRHDFDAAYSMVNCIDCGFQPFECAFVEYPIDKRISWKSFYVFDPRKLEVLTPEFDDKLRARRVYISREPLMELSNKILVFTVTRGQINVEFRENIPSARLATAKRILY